MNDEPTGTAQEVPLIEAREVHKFFQVGQVTVHVLRGVRLAISRGERLGIVGASGAGKTTLINVLGTLESASRGEVYFEGRPYSRMSIAERTRLRGEQMGFVFQAYYLLPELTVLENVMLPAMVRPGGLGRRRMIAQRAEELLRRVGLAGRAEHRPTELSGGEQQRVALARALINNPRVVFADEPTGNLDSKTGAQVLECLFEVVSDGEHTLVLVSHDPAVVKGCTRVITISDGLIVEQAAKEKEE